MSNLTIIDGTLPSPSLDGIYPDTLRKAQTARRQTIANTFAYISRRGDLISAGFGPGIESGEGEIDALRFTVDGVDDQGNQRLIDQTLARYFQATPQIDVDGVQGWVIRLVDDVWVVYTVTFKRPDKRFHRHVLLIPTDPSDEYAFETHMLYLQNDLDTELQRRVVSEHAMAYNPDVASAMMLTPTGTAEPRQVREQRFDA